MADGTFGARMDELARRVGRGTVVASVTFVQVYSHYQDSGIGPPQHPHIPATAFRHPRGGQAEYLSGTLRQLGPALLHEAGAGILAGDESAGEAMTDAANRLRQASEARAPREFWVLRNSAEAKVEHDGAVVYYSPPLIPRLSQGALNAIRRAGRGRADVTVNRQALHPTGYRGGAFQWTMLRRMQGRR